MRVIPITRWSGRSRRPLLAVLAALSTLALCSACGGGSAGEASTSEVDDRPVVVVTHPVLGSVVEDLVDGRARVEVLMAPGVDPHDYQPSAGDVEKIGAADLVIVNGGDLEEGLVGVIEQAADDGTPVFRSTDHLPPRHRDETDEDHDHDGAVHDHEGVDPHFWVDPVAMGQVVEALAPVVRSELGIDVGTRAAEIASGLQKLDAEVREILSPIPLERRLLVTAHESLGWFADRYGLVQLGALVPSLTSQASPSAAALARIVEEVERHEVPAVFVEAGASHALAEALADQTGVRLVELDAHTPPHGTSYVELIRRIAERMAEGLAP